MQTSPPHSNGEEGEEEFMKQLSNTYYYTQLKQEIMTHPKYPHLIQKIRNSIEGGRSMEEWGIPFHDFLSITSIFLADGINCQLANGENLFEDRDICE